MFGSGYIDQNANFLKGEPFELPGYGTRLDYTKKNGDQIIYRKQLDLSRFIRSQDELNILNKLLKNSPQIMEPPASNHVFQRDSGSIVPLNAEKSNFFNFNRLNLDLMRKHMNLYNKRLTQDDLDLFLSTMLILIEQADEGLVTHPNLRLKDVFIDDPYFKVLSPLISDEFLMTYTRDFVKLIQASGSNWTPNCYMSKVARNNAATQDTNIHTALKSHAVWLSQMIKHAFITALSMAVAIDDCVFYDSQGNPNKTTLGGALQVFVYLISNFE